MSGDRIVLDTNIILYLLNGDNTLADFLQDKKVYISVITELELLGYQNISKKEQNSVVEFLKCCSIININNEIKSIYFDLRKKYNLKLGDAIIASTAIYSDFPFISADKVFLKIEELQLTHYKPD